MAQFTIPAVQPSIQSEVTQAHLAAARAERVLDQILADLVIEASSNASAQGVRSGVEVAGLMSSMADLTARINGIAALADRVQQLTTGARAEAVGSSGGLGAALGVAGH